MACTSRGWWHQPWDGCCLWVLVPLLCPGSSYVHVHPVQHHHRAPVTGRVALGQGLLPGTLCSSSISWELLTSV